MYTFIHRPIVSYVYVRYELIRWKFIAMTSCRSRRNVRLKLWSRWFSVLYRSTALQSAEPSSQLIKENSGPQITFFSTMQFLLRFVHMRATYSVQKVCCWRVFSNSARFDRVPTKYAESRSERRARPHRSLEHNALVYLLPALSSFRFSISPVAFGWSHCGTLTRNGGVFHPR